MGRKEKREEKSKMLPEFEFAKVGGFLIHLQIQVFVHLATEYVRRIKQMQWLQVITNVEAPYKETMLTLVCVEVIQS